MTFADFLADAHPEIDPVHAGAALDLVAEGTRRSSSRASAASGRAARRGGAGGGARRKDRTTPSRAPALRRREIARQNTRAGFARRSKRRSARRLGDLYLPYRRRQTGATAALDDSGRSPTGSGTAHTGRRPPGQTLELWAFTFRNEEHGLTDLRR
jgi:hypothetical protein